MVDRLENSRAFLTEFIELYRSLPCLWHTKSKEYRDRAVKNKAYGVLVKKYREVDETADKKTVKCKINALRTTYRKVLCKINQSMESSTTGADVYKPTLWYFHLFDFLNEREEPDESKYVEHYYDEMKHDVEDEENPQSDVNYDTSAAYASASSASSTPTFEHQFISSIEYRTHPEYKKRKHSQSSTQEEEHAEDVASIAKSNSYTQEDCYDIFGRYIAHKLRSLPTKQNVFAQKLINDIIFEGEMSTLTRECKVVSGTQQ